MFRFHYLKIVVALCLITTISLFLSPLATAQAEQAIASTSDVKLLLDDYSQYMATGNTSQKTFYSDQIAALIAERQDYYSEFFTVGLHSQLISIESNFLVDDAGISTTGATTSVTILEVVTLYGQYDLESVNDYPLLLAAEWAISKSDNESVQQALRHYIATMTDDIKESLSHGVTIVFRVNHNISIEDRNGKLQIVKDEFTDKGIDIGEGFDNVNWTNGHPTRTKPDLTLMPDYEIYNTPIESLGKLLLDDYTRAYGDISTVEAITSFTYNRTAAKNYARTYVVNTIKKCPYNTSIYMDTKYYNTTYKNVWSVTTTTCNDCTDYVSQALKAGGFPTDSTWNHSGSGSYTWNVFDFRTSPQGLAHYLLNTKQAVEVYSSYISLLSGDLMYTDGMHVVMVTDVAPNRFSGHTNDRYNYPYTSSLTHFWHIKNTIP